VELQFQKMAVGDIMIVRSMSLMKQIWVKTGSFFLLNKTKSTQIR